MGATAFNNMEGTREGDADEGVPEANGKHSFLEMLQLEFDGDGGENAVLEGATEPRNVGAETTANITTKQVTGFTIRKNRVKGILYYSFGEIVIQKNCKPVAEFNSGKKETV